MGKLHHKVLEYLDKLEGNPSGAGIMYTENDAPYFEAALQHRAKEDKVNHPLHYNTNSIETIDIIKGSLTKEEFEGYLKGNILKYTCRFKHKNGLEDVLKAQWYLNKLIEELK